MRYNRRKIESLGKTFININEIAFLFGLRNHSDIVEKITELKEEGLIKPLTTKSQTISIKRPRIEEKYRFIKEESSNSTSSDINKEQLKEEILCGFPCFMNTDYYYENIEDYAKDKEIITTMIDAYNKGKLEVIMSMNERSFELFLDEKYLSDSSDVSRVCKRLDVNMDEFLNFYRTPEPFFYQKTKSKGDILIVENKDTFYTLKKIFADKKIASLFNIDVSLLIYGEGWKIISSIYDLIENDDFSETLSNNPRIYYWGDVDREGLAIFDELLNLDFPLDRELLLGAYEEMFRLSANKYRECKKKQKLRSNYSFLTELDGLDSKIYELIKENKYIPQEILSYRVIVEEVC